MDILITGDISSLSSSLVKVFIKDKNKIIIASQDAPFIKDNTKYVTSHPVDLTSDLFFEVLSPYRFDLAIYLSTREEQLFSSNFNNTGYLLDGLRNTLELCKRSRIPRFVSISSSEVYGNNDEFNEEVQPLPASINGSTLLAGEQICRYYQDHHGVNAHIIRVPFTYSSENEKTLIASLLRDCRLNNPVVFPGGREATGTFLHAEDIAQFIRRLADEPYNRDHLVINLASPDQFQFQELWQLLAKHFPKAQPLFKEGETVHTKSVPVQIAKEEYDWIALHDFRKELPSIIKQDLSSPAQKQKPKKTAKKEMPGGSRAMRWVELFVGAGLMHWLNNVTGTLIQFRFIDFRLLFVVLLGSLHGITFGLLAAFIACLSILFSWYQTGMDWALLIYNVENWLPIALYLLAGAITGYQHDKKENEVAFQDKQVKLINEKYSVLFGVYTDIGEMKNRLREQLLGYRDSFGRLFSITQELDTYNEADVFLKALDILEEFLSNQSIAIYTLKGDNPFARLIVSSKPLSSKLAKSLNLNDFPEMKDKLSQKTIFQNTALLKGHPAYAVPIFNEEKSAAMVVVWDASFDQHSMYFYNLLKVICGLIQSSIVRAAFFENSNLEKIYVSGTKILNPSAFSEIYKIKSQMQNNHVASFRCLKVEKDGKKLEEIGRSIEEGIRTTDYVGLDNNGSCFILLSQADINDTGEIIKRLSKLGIKCRDAEESEIVHV